MKIENVLKRINQIIYGSYNGKRVYQGVVRTINVTKLEIGRILMTTFGIGKIVNIIPSNKYEKTPITVDFRLDKIGTTHRLEMKDLKEYVVYHNDIFIPILPANYYFIGLNNQEIEYYITNKNYAKMTKECEKQYSFFTIFHKFKNGRSILLTLYKNRFKIVKQDETEEIGKRYIITRFNNKQYISK